MGFLSDAMATRYRVSDIERYLDFRCFMEIVLVSAQLYNAVIITAVSLRDWIRLEQHSRV